MTDEELEASMDAFEALVNAAEAYLSTLSPDRNVWESHIGCLLQGLRENLEMPPYAGQDREGRDVLGDPVSCSRAEKAPTEDDRETVAPGDEHYYHPPSPTCPPKCGLTEGPPGESSQWPPFQY